MKIFVVLLRRDQLEKCEKRSCLCLLRLENKLIIITNSRFSELVEFKERATGYGETNFLVFFRQKKSISLGHKDQRAR